MAASDPSDPNESRPTDSGNDSSRRFGNSAGRNRSENLDHEGVLKPPRDAMDDLDVERRRLIDERQAFEAFRSRVERITLDGEPTPTAPPTSLHRQAQVSGSGLVAVRDAYHETVMAVPHYEAEYNDTYPQSLVAEFGPEVAVALTQGSAFTERYKRSLRSKTMESIDERERLIEAVDMERESLERTTGRLASITEELRTLAGSPLSALDYGALDAYRVRTETLESNCDAVARRRQRELAATNRSLQLDDTLPDVATYLYQNRSVTYPALATVGELGDRLCTLRDRIEREMITRR